MRFLNIAGYQFITLQDLPSLRQAVLKECQFYQLKGTILLSHEGININLVGEPEQIEKFIAYIQNLGLFQTPIRFHRTYSVQLPFKRLKVKLKKEIITLREKSANPTPQLQTPRVSPIQLKQMLDEKRPIMLLDTRNDFEIQLGTFKGARHLQLNHFGELPDKLTDLDRQQEIIIFCTGGIRCEKAGLYMQSQGFSKVYQLNGGILGYFTEVGGEHFIGKCFVFDERISINSDLSS